MAPYSGPAALTQAWEALSERPYVPLDTRAKETLNACAAYIEAPDKSPEALARVLTLLSDLEALARVLTLLSDLVDCLNQHPDTLNSVAICDTVKNALTSLENNLTCQTRGMPAGGDAHWQQGLAYIAGLKQNLKTARTRAVARDQARQAEVQVLAIPAAAA